MEDIAKAAETVIKKLSKKNLYKNSTMKIPVLTTSQIRKILTAINTISNKISIYKAHNPRKNELSEELVSEIQYLKVKIVYQVGKDDSHEKAVKEFVEYADLINKINNIGRDIKKYEEFSKYIEALVAYHKFYGGKDK
jgi:CRISPR-associated protein Csm2